MRKAFLNRAKEEMANRNLANGDLAKELKISEAYMSEILTGKKFAPEQRRRISEILGIELTVEDVLPNKI